MKIYNWKLFEGKYQEFISDINKYEENIKKSKMNYREDVLEVFYDILDDYTYKIYEPGEISDDDEVFIRFKLKYNEFEDFINSLKSKSDFIKNYIGKELMIFIINIMDISTKMINLPIDKLGELKNYMEGNNINSLNSDTLMYIVVYI